MAVSYTRPERIADAIVHAFGVTAAAIAAAVLLGFAIAAGRADRIVAAAIYGFGLLATFGFSAAYNLCPTPVWKERLRRCDHAAIYLMIAGTYTPLALVAIGGATGIALLAAVWTVAFAGLVLKLGWPRRFERLSLVLYLALGWCGLFALGAIIRALPVTALILLLLGGLLYTVGVGFHVWERLKYQNAIWHGCVLSAAACHYAAVVQSILPT